MSDNSQSVKSQVVDSVQYVDYGYTFFQACLHALLYVRLVLASRALIGRYGKPYAIASHVPPSASKNHAMTKGRVALGTPPLRVCVRRGPHLFPPAIKSYSTYRCLGRGPTKIPGG